MQLSIAAENRLSRYIARKTTETLWNNGIYELCKLGASPLACKYSANVTPTMLFLNSQTQK